MVTEEKRESETITEKEFLVKLTAYTRMAYEKAVSDGAFDGSMSDFLNQYIFKYFEGNGTRLRETPEEEVRRIEISIFDEEAEVVFNVTGNVTRKTAHNFMEGVGHAFVPEEPRRGLRLIPPGYPVAVGKTSCEHTRDCTDYPRLCSRCDNNKAKSYFTPKEEE